MSQEERAAFASRIKHTVAKFDTQEAAAVAARVSLTQLKNWMNGASAPSLLAVARLALVHNVDIRWIAYGDDVRWLAGAPPCVSQDRERIRTARLALADASECLSVVTQRGTSDEARSVAMQRAVAKVEEARNAITRKASV